MLILYDNEEESFVKVEVNPEDLHKVKQISKSLVNDNKFTLDNFIEELEENFIDYDLIYKEE